MPETRETWPHVSICRPSVFAGGLVASVPGSGGFAACGCGARGCVPKKILGLGGGEVGGELGGEETTTGCSGNQWRLPIDVVIVIRSTWANCVVIGIAAVAEIAPELSRKLCDESFSGAEPI